VDAQVPWWVALPHVANVVTVSTADELLVLLRKVRSFDWIVRERCGELCSPSEAHRLRFDQASTMSKLVAVEYLAAHCHSCRSLAPKLCKLAQEEFQNVLFVKVVVQADSDGGVSAQQQAIAQLLGVDRFPFFQLFKGSAGKVAEFTANLSADSLDRLRWALRYYSTPCTTLVDPSLQKGPASVLVAPGWPVPPNDA